MPLHVSDDAYFQNVLTRTTVPIVTTANPDGPTSDVTGVADTTLLINPARHVDISDRYGITWGPILGMQFPTATEKRTGSDKWSTGPG